VSLPLSGAPPRERRVRIVVADDSERFRDGMARAVERSGTLELLAAVADGPAALQATLEHRPDVLVLDERMPLMNGTDVATRVRVDQRLLGVRVVLLTASTDPELLQRARTAGAITCIDKARSRREICAAIADASC
jgi:CheY-like chemotaxis protein